MGRGKEVWGELVAMGAALISPRCEGEEGKVLAGYSALLFAVANQS